MKWFTRGWQAGEFSEAETERIRHSYWEHIRSISARLEPAVAKLACEINLHDAIIEQVHVYAHEQRLVLSLVAGDQQGGYREVVLEYFGVEIGARYLDMLRQRCRDRETEILYDEIDIDQDGKYVHGLLFWPEGEVSIWFKHLKLASGARADRRTLLSGAFVEHD